jgi:photosystem II stability/assembly factor-like uncharacterized protein
MDWRIAALRLLVFAALIGGSTVAGLVGVAERADAAPRRLSPAAFSAAVSSLPAAGGGGGGVVGGEPTGPDWEATPINAAVTQLVLSNGVVYAVSLAGGGAPAVLWRGERGGTEWRMLPAPSARIADLAVHPLDDRVLYLATEAGISRSVDAGQTWATILPASAGEQGLRIVVSPADPRLLYATTGLFSGAMVWRSADGGANWTRLHDLQGALCTWTFPVIAPDATIVNRVFLSYACAAGRTTSARLTVSEDQWASDGEPLLVPSARNDDPLGYLYPQEVAFAPDRQRGVVQALRDQRLGGSALLRTDTGGRTWRALLNYGPSMANGRQVAPNVVLGGLVADGPNFERLFVGLGRDGQGVLGSMDGGASWRQVGRGAVGGVRSLALDTSSGVLYAGTDSGLWRLPAIASPSTPG